MPPKYDKDTPAALGLYGTSGPEFYWKEARTAMLTETRSPLALHMRRSALPLTAWKGGGVEDVRVRVASSSHPGRSSPAPSPARRRRSTSVRCAARV